MLHRIISLLCLALIDVSQIQAQVIEGKFPEEGIISPHHDSFFDPHTDYSQFAGRVSDRSADRKVFKVKFANNNVKFFRAGDPLTFAEALNSDDVPCKGFVKGIEDYYLTVHVPNVDDCRRYRDGQLRIGTILQFHSAVLRERVAYAGQYRYLLLQQRVDMFKQLSDVNHFLWAFEQEKINVAAEYDKKILELNRQKQVALDDLLNKKKEQVVVQAELKKELDLLEEKLHFYRIDRTEDFAMTGQTTADNPQ